MSTRMANGFYRAIVMNNSSSTLQVQIPQLFGTAVIAARSCMPPGAVALPPVGTVVWVGFEDGEARLPIWIGVGTSSGVGSSPGQTTLTGLPGENVLLIRASPTDTGLHTLLNIEDKGLAPVLWVNNAGGLNVNDNFNLVRTIFSNPNVFGDIYGYLGHGDPLSMMYRHAGPPGNMLDVATATGEIFQGSRGPSSGNWATGFGATGIAGGANPFGLTNNPGGMLHVIYLTQAFGSNLVARSATIGTFSSWTPCVEGNYLSAVLSLRAATTTRTISPALVFCDATGATIAGTITGSSVSSVTGSWVQAVVGGNAPTGAHGVCLQLGASSVTMGELHYLTACGIWCDTRISGAADPNAEHAWCPPFTGQNDGTGWTSVCMGDQHTRLDQVGVSGKRIYLMDGAPGVFYLPRQVGAPGSTATPRWVSVA